MWHRLIDGKTTDGPDIDTPQALALLHEPKANVERYDGLRVRIVGGRHASDPASAPVVIMLRSLKMYGMTQAVTDLIEQGAQPSVRRIHPAKAAWAYDFGSSAMMRSIFS
ncbi:hypothetical protein ELG72_36910 [Rhizobium leguminosarum]|uniref:hypothetical protein n=1 Tax=Rhizobium leguminosarum TaxID=384 RepID=UPI001032235F|nr:hypothetical protein [Rhizobium leguminosarum]TBF87453.1 hypothetical protein ELG82_38450 [Rhizobium leguminosarum]TBG07064.1 hypothetical protein ELG80_37615 [Rhizobium leguminosarum]TBG07784.1 hypothetical protein ELG81_36810 [Rhizobium leguminosarum]TBG30755.1 hypothetical protein ELG75_37315 [Rhizobium leguminosarum]TBG50083.1 hypothetical protein ELG72_36910 [Rhizobium leguminosarum]